MMTSPSLFTLPSARVLAFAKDWAPEALDAQTIQALRERIRSLGAELFVVTERGTFALTADDDASEYRDRIPADLATAATQFTARRGADAVFVIDGAHAVRVGHGSGLMSALDAAAELLVTRRLVAQAPPAPFASLHRWMEKAS